MPTRLLSVSIVRIGVTAVEVAILHAFTRLLGIVVVAELAYATVPALTEIRSLDASPNVVLPVTDRLVSVDVESASMPLRSVSVSAVIFPETDIAPLSMLRFPERILAPLSIAMPFN